MELSGSRNQVKEAKQLIQGAGVEIMNGDDRGRGWINLMVSEEKQGGTSGAAKMLVERRLGILKDFVEETGVELQVRLISSKDKKVNQQSQKRR